MDQIATSRHPFSANSPSRLTDEGDWGHLAGQAHDAIRDNRAFTLEGFCPGVYSRLFVDWFFAHRVRRIAGGQEGVPLGLEVR